VGANQLARDEPTVITAWQGDTGTGLPGFETNEPIIARLWHPTLDLETTVPLIGVSGESLRFGEGPYGIATIPQNALSTDAEEIPPASFGIESAFPNPFQSSLSLRISVPTTETVSVEVYNLLGQRVAQLSNGVLEAGVHDLMWRASEKSAGVYIIKVVSPLGSIVKLVTKVD
jgi:hypothetical protein